MTEAERGDEFEGAREVMTRAIRRLDVLEWMILAFAVGVALLGGAAVAFLLSVGTGLPFRPSWAIVSILLLAVPGAFVFGRELRTTHDPGERDGEDPERTSPNRNRGP